MDRDVRAVASLARHVLALAQHAPDGSRGGPAGPRVAPPALDPDRTDHGRLLLAVAELVLPGGGGIRWRGQRVALGGDGPGIGRGRGQLGTGLSGLGVVGRDAECPGSYLGPSSACSMSD